jgi:hypothetical protein
VAAVGWGLQVAPWRAREDGAVVDGSRWVDSGGVVQQQQKQQQHRASHTATYSSVAPACSPALLFSRRLAVSLCREADGSTPIDALLFLSTCLTDYASVPGGVWGVCGGI